MFRLLNNQTTEERLRLYTRQQPIGLLFPSGAIVVGCGGTGMWTAFLLAMSGVESLMLMDGDHLEESNRNRLPYKPEDVGLPKTVALRQIIQSIRPECSIDTDGIADTFTLALIDTRKFCVLFDCTDNIRTQRFLNQWCKDNDVEYIRAGYNGLHMTVGIPPPAWTTDDAEHTGYDIIPSWVIPAIIPAALAVAKACLYPDLTFSGELGTITSGTQRLMTHEEKIEEKENVERQRERDEWEEEREDCSESATHEDCNSCEHSNDCPFRHEE